MPTTGFIKFREVTGGVFSTGALSGIGASATAADVQGWMSLPHDAAANFTVPRLGKHSARGGKFFLETTTGVRGQTFQVPTDGSAVMFAPGLFIETGVDTNLYEFWPALNGSTNGWATMHLGNAAGTTDIRQKFLKSVAGGSMVMGETLTSASLAYASLAAQSSTYAEVTHSCTYTWANDIVEVYYATGHLLETGQQTGLDFTSGGATADGIYTVTVLDPYHFTVPLSGSGTAGNVTSKPGVTVTFTAHTMNIGESVYCDFTSGTGVDGTYEVYAVTSANAYLIKYPHVTALTSGNVSCIHSLVITYTAHGFAQGQTFYIDFTSGTGVDGVYVAKVVATNTITINFPHSPITSGNCTLSRDIGYVCGAGRRTWIPSNILNEVATGARATNTAPNATIATRPEWATTSAGAIDLEYLYACSGYFNCSQPYSIRLLNCVFFDSVIISEVATALDMDSIYVGMTGALDVQTLSISNCYAGGTVKNVKAFRGNTPGTTDHAMSITYCKGQTFENVEAGIIQYARSTGLPIQVTTCNQLIFNSCRAFNGNITLTNSPNITINNHDHVERFNGNGLAAITAIALSAGCHNLVIDGVTFGFNNQVLNQMAYQICNPVGCNNVKVRNVGSLASPIPKSSWAPNLASMTYIFSSGGSNDTVRYQKLFVEGVKTAPYTNINSDKNILYESVKGGNYVWSTKALLGLQHADLNGQVKNCYGPNGVTGQASVYGTHFIDFFMGDYGRFILACNETTTETASQFGNDVGTALFNSSGGVIVRTIGNQCTFTDNVFRKGYTGFNKTEVVMSGGTITNYNLHYQIDKGSGFSSWRNLYYQRSGAAGTSGQYTFTVTDATGVAVGDYCFGTGLSTLGINIKNAAIPKVTQVNGNTITVDVANTGTVSGIIRFNQLPNESDINPAVGFKMKWRITAVLTATAAITYIRADALTSLAAQDNYYVLDTVDVELTTLDILGNIVENVQVLLTANTGGYLPFKETVSISNSGTTATVTHSNHGLVTNDKVLIKGASHYQNNGVFQIVVIDNNTYTYTMISYPGSNPTGSITSTFVFLNGETDAQGKIMSSMYISENQPVIGIARKSNSSPYYKASTIIDTVSSINGASINTFMLLDE